MGVLMETMKAQPHFTEEFKFEAVKQMTERGHPIAEVAVRLDKIRRLKAELRHVTKERDILKRAAAYFAKQSNGGRPIYDTTW